MVKLRMALFLVAVSVALFAPIEAAQADNSVNVRIRPQNDSGVMGTATLTATNAGDLTVVIHARGLVPGQPHAQHIHGSMGGRHFMCPSLSDDANGDGVLTNEEATGEYGTIFVSLTTSGDVSAESGLAVDRMPVADSSGHLNYRRTLPAAMLPDGLVEHLSSIHLVQHGIDVNDNDKYDLAGLGESSFAKNLGAAGVPEEATDPASCGLVTGAAASVAAHGGVEAGGGDSATLSVPLAAGGGLLVALAATVLIARRPERARGVSR